MYKYFTSESVTEGHPDKICDQISDAILEEILSRDPSARVAVETLVSTGLVLVAGEVTTETYVDIQKIVRDKVEAIGYDRGKYGFDAQNLAVLVCLNEQSKDIAMGVDETTEKEQGAGDQGMMFGYAINQTPTYMPISHYYASLLARRLAFVRKENILDYLRPDGKTQVTAKFSDDGKFLFFTDILISTQHAQDISQEQIREDIINHVIKVVVPEDYIKEDTKIHVNPTGRFVVGGPQGDSGLTGRKIIVDTYGGRAHHGGGAFSGKDPSKVDRSAAYATRHIAKNIVAAGLADEIEIQVSYAIGEAKPVSIGIDCFNTEKISEVKIIKIIEKHFDLRPKAIIDRLKLRSVKYSQVAAYGHFGRDDLDLPWEKLDMVDLLKTYLTKDVI
ncbi:MAG: methionine adenosyltransferase [Candidatus Izemoplasmatales bacterium]|uniref:S-adenosylmethionine synthase n=1 Tax=Hujiaoplasma nucleasis TaxID=2725268 RepID=A0A7L6N3M0_9MOLU|nr:methionine adenosyltransferase [Hujiaoplasma nucleasis]QLY40042.1 methionine adenosyltransferase [Hujiaoplasma nucleasis]